MRHVKVRRCPAGRLSTLFAALLLLLCGCSLTACRTSQDADAAASQMTGTAAALDAYYRTLADGVTGNIRFNELDAVFSQVPFDAQSRKPLEDTRAELLQRAAMAQQMERLAAAFSSLTNSSAPADAQDAASALASQVGQLHPLPGGPIIPDLIGKSANLIVLAIQEKKERDAARAMDGTLAAVADLFEKEKPIYDSLARTYSKQAALVATDMLTSGRVDLTPMLLPALRPFDLAPLPLDAATGTSLQKLAVQRVQSSADAATASEAAASAAMLAALREMSARMHHLAVQNAMPERGAPVTLNEVEAWIHWAAR